MMASSNKDNKQLQVAGKIQMVHTSAALQHEKQAQYGLNKTGFVSKAQSSSKPNTTMVISSQPNAPGTIGKQQQSQKSSIKQKSTFTRNIEAVHDRAAHEQMYGGGTSSQPSFTAYEAEKGRKRVHKSMSKTITSVVNQHQQAKQHHGSSFGGAGGSAASQGPNRTSIGGASGTGINRHSSPMKSQVHLDGRDGLPGESGALKATDIAHNRQNCIGENEQANRIGFEHRVREVMTMRNTGNVLNARVIETWINETLSDAEHLDIPGVILKPQQKDPLARYYVDRLHLISENVDVAAVDRIYRGLFVYSIGFYEMLYKALGHAKNKYTILSSIWKVYSILLEYCCRSSYQTQLAQMHTEHQEALAKMEERFNFDIKQLNANERDLKLELDDLQKADSDLRKRLEDEIRLRIKLQEEIYKNIRSHEEEVQLRLQFESKLNGLHSLHRDLQAKYERALDDIYRLDLTSKAIQEKYDQVETEVVGLRSLKIEHESKISYQEERIRALNVDIEQKVRAYQSIEQKLLKAQETIEEKNLQIKDQDQKMDQLVLLQESERALINGLKSEKQHLELQLKENTALKEQFMMKCNQVQEMYESLFKEAQQFKRTIVGVDEIKKDRDTRVSSLRAEVEQLQAQLDQITSEHASLKVHAKSLTEDNVRLRASHKTIEANLHLANDVRDQADKSLQELQRQYKTIKEAYLDKEEMLNTYKRKFEEEQNKLTQIEAKADTLEIEKKSLEKQNDIQRKQLLDKINQQSELIAAEKDTREIWINRYEKEQKAHIKTHQDYMQMRGEMQEMTLKYENQRTVSESLESIKNSLKKSHDELQGKVTAGQVEIERLKREVYTQEKLLAALKMQHEKYVDTLKEDKVAVAAQHQEQVEQHQMHYEDLRNMTHMYWTRIQELDAIVEGLREELAEMTRIKEDLDEKLANKEKQYDELTEKYIQLTKELGEEKAAHKLQILDNHRLEEEIKDLKKQIVDFLDRIQEFKQKIAELEEQNDGHLARIKEQDDEIEVLKERLENKKERWDVQIQTACKTKTKKTQTVTVQIYDAHSSSDHLLQQQAATGSDPKSQNGMMNNFGHVSEDGQHFVDHQTVNSTNLMGSTQLQFQPHPQFIKNHSSQTNVFDSSHAGGMSTALGGPVNNSSMIMQRPRVQSASRSGPGGGSQSMLALNMIDGPNVSLLQQQRMQQNNTQVNATVGPGGIMDIRRGSSMQRPAKSAANKYRHLMPTNTSAIAEEIDYDMRYQDKNIMIGGFLQNQGLPGEDMDSVNYHPSGLQIHRNERRSAVRLKHRESEIQTGQQHVMHKTAQHTVSHGAGVLLGNNFLQSYGQKERLTTATMRSQQHDPNLLREFANDSKTSGGIPASNNLKSVYNMRVSHSNLAAKNAKVHANNTTRAGKRSPGGGGKRKHLQSAAQATRTVRQLNSNMSEHSPPDGRKHTATHQLKGVTTTTNNASVLSQKHNPLNASLALSQLQETNETNYPMAMQKKMTYISHSYLPATSQSHYRPHRNVGTAASSSRNNLIGAKTGEMDIQVKGKSSIRTLIRLANSRALSERGGGSFDLEGKGSAKGGENVSIVELNSADSGGSQPTKSLVKATVTSKVRKSMD